LGISSKRIIILIHSVYDCPRGMQDRCYRASRELFSNYLFLFPYTFFNGWPTSQIGRRIFTRNGSNDAVSRKGVS